MDKQKLNFWLTALIAIPAFIWLLVELIRVFLEVTSRSGISSVLFDGVIQHKIGELMVGVPLFLIILFSGKWAKERLFALISRMQIVMIIGGLLNALAWYSLREREAWNGFFRIWCLIILFVGLFGATIAKWLVNRTKEKS